MNPIPEKWLVSPRQKRIICHWTVGSYTASPVCMSSYHLLVEQRDGKANLTRGDYPLNVPMPHTYMFNSAIGVSVCALGGYQSTSSPGKYPITKQQWDLLVQTVAQLCREFGIPVTPDFVLMHGEVTQNLGVDQWGKWDIGWLPHLGIYGASNCGNQLRAEVLRLINGEDVLPKLSVRLQGSPTVMEGLLYDGSGMVPVRNFVSWADLAGYDLRIERVKTDFRQVSLCMHRTYRDFAYTLFPGDDKGWVSLRELTDFMGLEIDVEAWSPTRKVLVLKKPDERGAIVA